MEGGEDAESTTMVVEVVRGEWERGGTRWQTDRESVQVQEFGVSDTHREAALSGKHYAFPIWAVALKLTTKIKASFQMCTYLKWFCIFFFIDAKCRFIAAAKTLLQTGGLHTNTAAITRENYTWMNPICVCAAWEVHARNQRWLMPCRCSCRSN